MPTVYTRQEKFISCMDHYMSLYDTHLKNDDPDFIADLHWKLEKQCQRGNNYVVYTLDISRKYTAYIMDAPYELDGVVYPAGPVKKMNKHTSELFREHFTDHFKPHEQRDEYGILHAKVSLYRDTDVNEDMLRHQVSVSYHNSYLLPFPVPIQCLSLYEQALLRQVEKLKEICLTYKSREKRFKSKIASLEGAVDVTMERAERKIKELYARCDTKEDCPVCYEPILCEKLVVPTCCHYICSDCSERWAKGCPICRG